VFSPMGFPSFLPRWRFRKSALVDQRHITSTHQASFTLLAPIPAMRLQPTTYPASFQFYLLKTTTDRLACRSVFFLPFQSFHTHRSRATNSGHLDIHYHVTGERS
jgi:hypothetical protein